MASTRRSRRAAARKRHQRDIERAKAELEQAQRPNNGPGLSAGNLPPTPAQLEHIARLRHHLRDPGTTFPRSRDAASTLIRTLRDQTRDVESYRRIVLPPARRDGGRTGAHPPR